MTEEDEEFNRIEREAAMRKEAVAATVSTQRQRVVFPTMLRKMWSGSEVQAWLDENVNKEKKT